MQYPILHFSCICSKSLLLNKRNPICVLRYLVNDIRKCRISEIGALTRYLMQFRPTVCEVKRVQTQFGPEVDLDLLERVDSVRARNGENARNVYGKCSLNKCAYFR